MYTSAATMDQMIFAVHHLRRSSLQLADQILSLPPKLGNFISESRLGFSLLLLDRFFCKAIVLRASISDFPLRLIQVRAFRRFWDTMGAFISRFWFMLFPAKEYKIVVVGLDNAGKTTTLYKLHLGEVVTTHPTVGSNVEELVYKNIRFEVWDLGGQERLRTSWATYYRGTHAVIAVIDSTDRARISIMKDELFRLLGHDDLQQSVVLVFANKQDLKDAMTPVEITDALSLHSIKNHDWHIQACSALTGDGLYDGLGWIAQQVTGKTPS
ncbi:ADP-ribosylation factor-like protein 5 isoform X1 [Cucurbita pepo subsp. pepo]|nr:ADP-ribosylation factor-like protein 5 isoform X1 [Cucurbita pepo subsp. pepo]